ncbi:MAG: hypothetical protein ACPGPE_12555 [Planctomycetota bacterium]
MSVPNHHLDLRVSEEDGVFVLRAPDVGYFTAPLGRGAVVAPGMDAGALQRLGGTASLRVPDGVRGAVISDPFERVLAAVGYGDELYRIDPAGVGEALQDEGAGEDPGVGLVLVSEQSGRVWHRPAPGEDPFCAPGDVLEDGAAVCLIEVMKTFSTVPYRASRGLPARARVVRWLAADGGDVQKGDPILGLEPA